MRITIESSIIIKKSSLDRLREIVLLVQREKFEELLFGITINAGVDFYWDENGFHCINQTNFPINLITSTATHLIEADAELYLKEDIPEVRIRFFEDI